MAMPSTPYRMLMVPASFRGIEFQVEHNSLSGGRRNVTFEFPKRDIPYTEDMGRRAQRWSVTAYIVSPNYVSLAAALTDALREDGSGSLTLPTLGTFQANVDTFQYGETREKGGFCTFEIAFVEAGNLQGSGVSVNTALAVANTASQMATSTINTLNDTLSSITA